MMQIIFWGLIVTLKLVSGDCIIGKQNVNNFDYIKATGSWYVLLHSNNTTEDKSECVVATHETPQGKVALTNLTAYNISNLEWEILIVAIDYDNYVVLKKCPFVSSQLSVYVGFRRKHPDKKIMRRVLKKLQDNNIYVSMLVEWKADHCQQAESSNEEASSE